MYGYMPAKTTIFNTRASPTHSFALAPRNTIMFSPHGRFVLVAGFGNLAGQMDVYDLEQNHLKICTIEASNASVCEWSPDGKFILTATTSPRLRVDNGVRIWHVGGGLLYNEDFQELYHVTWRPQQTSLQPSVDPLHPLPIPHASALEYLGNVKTPSRPAGAYRPPGARGQITPLAFKREDEGGAAYVSNGNLPPGFGASTFGRPRRREIPGAEPVPDDGIGATAASQLDGEESHSKAAAKNKKKREAKKAKDAAERVAGLAPIKPDANADATSSPGRSPGRSPERRDRRKAERNRSKGHPDGRPRSQQRPRDTRQLDRDLSSRPPPSQQQEEGNGLSAQATVEAPDLRVTSPDGGAGTQDKKVRALLKKLRAIDDLKMRRAGGEKLEGTQIKKMDTEDEIRKELGVLGWHE